MIAFAMLLITGARLGQTHGYRRVFVLSVTTFTSASVLCGIAPTPAVLVAARVLQGAGAALMFPQTLTGIQLSFEGAERARAIGLYAIALSSGAVAGQILGGGLISVDIAGTDWRAIFLVNAPIGAAVALAAMRHLPADGGRATRRVDVGGVATLSAAIALIVAPLDLGAPRAGPPGRGSRSPRVLRRSRCSSSSSDGSPRATGLRS
jgi:MFS family permease